MANRALLSEKVRVRTWVRPEAVLFPCAVGFDESNVRQRRLGAARIESRRNYRNVAITTKHPGAG